MVEIQSKTQKIVTAIYLISDLMDEKDPLRKSLRNLSVILSSRIGSMSIESPSQAKKTITEAQNYVDRIVSVLKVCVSVGMVSDMNFKIISESLYFVKDDLNVKYGAINTESLAASSFHNKAIHEFVLPDFITKDESVKTSSKQTERAATPVVSVHKVQSQDIKDKKDNVVKDTLKVQKKDDSRLDKVLDIVRQKGEVSVADVAVEFPETSEKTIQRMLVRLVEESKLNKTGEKRWSRYSLSNI